ncbi:MAG: hypothetical protein ACRD4D_01825 [Candidatus Acidiferrales bacterium]
MSLPRSIAIATVLSAFLTGWAATAGVVLELEEREPGSGAVVGRIVYRLEAGHLRIETRSQDDEETIVIFRADKPVAWILRPAEGTYYEFTPERVAALRKKMQEAEQRMTAELAKMPPEQRRAFEEMMERLGHQMGQPEPVSVRVAGREEKVGDYVCTRYQILRGEEMQAELWTTPPEKAQLRREEFDTVAALGRLLEPLGEEGPVRPLGTVRSSGGGAEVEGLPVRSLSYSEGEAYREEILVRASRQELDARLFELPANLRRAELEESLEEP